MAKTKVALTLDSDLLQQVDELIERRRFRNRSQAVESALADKHQRLAHIRLARESAKLNSREEQRLAVDRIGQLIARASEEELARPSTAPTKFWDSLLARSAA